MADFFKLITIRNSSNSGNIGNIDPRLDFSKIRSAQNSGNTGNLRNFALADFFTLRTIGIAVIMVTLGTLTLDWILPKQEVPGIVVIPIIQGTLALADFHKFLLNQLLFILFFFCF